ncbi:MAG: molybdate ABC transporter permease subunit [Paludibacterium sp.]|uniref:molybdate ABC transporter permease subunit n=1 Tax=Paludibacterium sp. TaxID=1917523 RepID=UPI0025DD5C02|nr:molybdate ABC transporter permease subunit [Paludibacterium sp.]MBV8047068.1 molybdate ABC transporter permease subunit [Paludibacterium sp.]MBV8646426.1 molybdate ABC transporter permease subunit [Paludibacterium sp.]
MPDLAPLWLSARLALLTTSILLVIGVPLAGWLAHRRSPFKPVVETLISMPLVLPPSVLGFYLLLLLTPTGRLGGWLRDTLGLQLVFSFPGLVFGSVLFSLPFMVQPVAAALSAQPPSLREAAWTLGRSRLGAFLAVELPGVRAALAAGAVMSFAHTVGEFGLVLMIGGNIPGVTQVASIAVYQQVEQMNYPAAHVYAGILCGFAFGVVLIVNLLRRYADRHGANR